MGKALGFILPVVAAIAAPEIFGPMLGLEAGGLGAAGLGAAAGGLTSGGIDYAENGHNFGKALEGGALSGAGSFVGANIGNALAGTGGAIGSAAPSGAGSITGSGSIGGLGGDSLGTSTGSGLSGEFASGLGGAPTLGTGSLAAPAATGIGAGSGSGGGASILGSLGNTNLGTIGSNLNSIGGGSIASMLPSSLANVGVGQAVGGLEGGSLASGLVDQTPPTPGFTPSQSSASSLPPSLSMLSSLSPLQQASNIATQGTYGGGVGGQEESYYANLLNRQLVDQSGNVSPLSSLSPIENTYDQQLGLGGFTNPTDLLKALSTWSPS